jgi:hypothetical protein
MVVFPVMPATGPGSSVTFTEALAVPQEFVPTTEYVPGWVTVMDTEVAMVLHTKVSAPLAVSNELPPGQMANWPLMATVGPGDEATSTEAVALPQAPVPTTE